jgi:hypothetical protein
MDYKKYSLENLENWIHDAMSAGEATPQEIYDVILGVVKENYYAYKQKASQAYELLGLLNNNNGQSYEDVMKEREYYEQSMPPWGHSDLEYLAHNKNDTISFNAKDKVKRCGVGDTNGYCLTPWNDFWTNLELPEDHFERDMMIYGNMKKRDKVVKWQLPIQVDGLTGDCFIQFPDDLLEVAGLKEGDIVEWIDRGDGSFEMRKVNGPE